MGRAGKSDAGLPSWPVNPPKVAVNRLFLGKEESRQWRMGISAPRTSAKDIKREPNRSLERGGEEAVGALASTLPFKGRSAMDTYILSLFSDLPCSKSLLERPCRLCYRADTVHTKRAWNNLTDQSVFEGLP